jgi:hypothetical protein
MWIKYIDIEIHKFICQNQLINRGILGLLLPSYIVIITSIRECNKINNQIIVPSEELEEMYVSCVFQMIIKYRMKNLWNAKEIYMKYFVIETQSRYSGNGKLHKCFI